MTISLPQIAAALQHVLTNVPTALARSSGFCQRRSKLTASCFVESLVLGWLADPAASLSQLSQRAADRGVVISPQGLAQRFTPAATTLLRAVWEATLAEVIRADPIAEGLMARFPAVILMDSTTIALPDGLATVWVGCGGRVPQGAQAALKLTVQLDLVTGQLQMMPSNGRAQDKASPLQRVPMPAGAVRVTDLGFWSLEVLQQIAAQGAYFVSRLHPQTTVFTGAGERLDLVTWLDQQTDPHHAVDVTLGVAARVPARLLAVRVPPAVAQTRRDAILADAQRESETPSARKLALVDWTLLVTNAPADVVSIPEALVLVRARWQIELLFKLWKDGGRLDEWRSRDPDRILCEVYAKLTALVIQHWLLLVGCWEIPDRSLVRAAHVVRDHAVSLLLALASHHALLRILTTVSSLLTRCRITRRRRKPALVQLLANPLLGP